MHCFNRAFLQLSVVLLLAPSARAAVFEDALAKVYQENPRILTERQRLQATDESVAQATSGFRPSVNASYSKGRQETSFNNGPEQLGDSMNKNIRVEQPLFRGGATFSTLNSARQRVKAGQANLDAIEQQVLLDTVQAYMDVLTNEAILDLSTHNQSVLGQQLKAADTRFKVGDITKTDVAQSKARLSNAKAAMIAAEGQLQSAKATFERLVGMKPEGKFTMPTIYPELPASLNEAVELAHTTNPQLLSAIHAAKSSFYDVRTNEAALLPTVSLVGLASRDNGVGAAGTSQFSQDRVSVEVRIPLYQAGNEYSRIRAAKATARSLDHESIDMRQSVDEAVTQAWVQWKNATATIAARKDQIKAAEVALNGVQQEHQFGERTLLDVLDAEQELFAARTEAVRAERDRIVAAYALAFRLGKLTPDALGLKVASYNPDEHAKSVEWQPAGF